jgi:glycosyltransferase involved in cell wall biosynthesis
MEMPGWFTRAKGLHFDIATVQLCPPHNFHHLPGRSVGFSMHESMSLPIGWSDHVNQKCQWLMVPSPWLVELFADEGVKVPIDVVPGGIEPDECPIQPQRHNRPYTFICLADRGNRKGHDLVYSAFYDAFDHRNQDVRLLIKCRPGSLPRLDFSYSNDPRLTIWREDVEAMADVFAHADACINPNRCEGYGMWPREAAAMGLPTVVTRAFGTADNADEWAIPLNKFTMAESHMDQCGGIWAQPDYDEIVETMRWLYTHQDEAKARALKAARWMRANQTYQHAAIKLLKVLAKYLGGKPPDELPELETLPEMTEHTNGKVHEAVTL